MGQHQLPVKAITQNGTHSITTAIQGPSSSGETQEHLAGTGHQAWFKSRCFRCLDGTETLLLLRLVVYGV